MGRKTESIDREYIKSGVWKCNKSPTGAHHWVEMIETERLASNGYFVCIHCLDVSRFPVHWEQVSPFTKKNIIEGGIK